MDKRFQEMSFGYKDMAGCFFFFSFFFFISVKRNRNGDGRGCLKELRVNKGWVEG